MILEACRDMSITRRWEKERDVSGGAHPWAEVATGKETVPSITNETKEVH